MLDREFIDPLAVIGRMHDRKKEHMVAARRLEQETFYVQPLRRRHWLDLADCALRIRKM